MAHRLVLMLIVVVLVAEHVVTTFGLPRSIKLLPEIFSLVALLIVVVNGVRNRFEFVAPKYWVAFAFVTLIMVSGIVINQVGAGPTVAGMRTYFRAIPLFLLPAVIRFSDEQIKQQLKLLLALSLLQFPVAAYQRWVVYSEGRWTGDEVFGTLQISSILSIFLISSVLILTGLRLRNYITNRVFLPTCLLLLIPTTINETKGTLVLLPIGILVALSVGALRGQRLRVALASLMLLIGFGAIFVPVYDYFMQPVSWNASIVDFFTDKEKLEKYLEKEGAGIGATDAMNVGRADAISISANYMSQDPIRLAFGLGLGSVSDSSLGSAFAGQYRQLFEHIAVMSFTVFLMEIGMFGITAVFLLYWFIFRDSLEVVHRDDGLLGALSIGWTGVIVIITLSMFYKNIHVFETLSYLFWYFSGLIAARRIQILT